MCESNPKLLYLSLSLFELFLAAYVYVYWCVYVDMEGKNKKKHKIMGSFIIQGNQILVQGVERSSDRAPTTITILCVVCEKKEEIHAKLLKNAEVKASRNFVTINQLFLVCFARFHILSGTPHKTKAILSNRTREWLNKNEKKIEKTEKKQTIFYIFLLIFFSPACIFAGNVQLVVSMSAFIYFIAKQHTHTSAWRSEEGKKIENGKSEHHLSLGRLHLYEFRIYENYLFLFWCLDSLWEKAKNAFFLSLPSVFSFHHTFFPSSFSVFILYSLPIVHFA